MFRNYLKTAWRNLRRNKIYGSINLAGFAIGLSACMLIMLYAEHEYSYDKFHVNSDRIFWMQSKVKIGSDSVLMMNQPYTSAPSAKSIEPSIESYVRTTNPGVNTIIANQSSLSHKYVEPDFLFADSNFFSFFSFTLVRGDKMSMLDAPFKVVISENAAKKYFGTGNPVGKIIRYNNSYNFMITGVAQETPSNSSIKYDFVASASSLASMSDEKGLLKDDNNAFTTYLLVRDKKDFLKAEAAMQQFDKSKYGAEMITRYIAMPLVDIHQHGNTDVSNTKYLYIFPMAAALVLLLALVNYMSLSTARSTVRAKEIGVRKVMGAQRKTIAIQFFIESALYTAIGFMLAFITCLLSKNFFFNFLQLKVNSSFLFSLPMLISYGSLFIISVVLSALYPAIVLSGFKPALVLYSRATSSYKSVSVRKLFTVFQFAISIILVICSISINRQLTFLRTADTGINRENVVMIPFSATVSKHYTSFRKDLAALSSVEGLSVALRSLYKGYNLLAIKPKNSDRILMMRTLYVDSHFIPMLGLKWKLPPNDTLGYMNNKFAMIVNETAAGKLNLGANLVDKRIDDKYIVTGVLKDFSYSSLENKVEGLCLFVSNDYDTSAKWVQKGGCAFVKIKALTNTPLFLQQVKNIYEKYDSENPFDNSFMDEAYDAQYKAEDRLSKILNVFTGFTIFIAALGLFGLATFTSVQRTKEIGIRKVLGASVQDVVFLLSKDFIKLVCIAAIIASPVAWYFAHRWLENFTYRIDLSVWIFLGASLLTVLVALFTISFQSIKAATTNPVKSLKGEGT